MITKTFVARKGSHLSNDEAARAGEFLDERFGDDPVTPEDVVKAAKPKRSPIHDLFEWDDTAAAKAHRLHQARMLVNSIEVVYAKSDNPTRAYHSVSVQFGEEQKQRAYMPAKVVWQTPDYSQQVIGRAFRELSGWRERYKEYQELEGAVELVTGALERIAA